MIRPLCAASLALLLLAGCDLDPRPRPAPPPPPDTACHAPGHHFAFLETDTRVYRQGAVVRITPAVNMAPAGTAELPLRCTKGWSVSGPATLAADRRSLAIAPDAEPGAIVAVAFTHLGKPVAARFKVVAKDAILLTGRWSQQGLEGCSGDEPVRELEFQPENRFAVTFTPFETYRDYWGRYEFDPATKAIRLKVEGGNFVPSNLDLEGQAELAGGRLRLSGLFLGSRDGMPRTGCVYRF
jgi:hypothetical protein